MDIDKISETTTWKFDESIMKDPFKDNTSTTPIKYENMIFEFPTPPPPLEKVEPFTPTHEPNHVYTLSNINPSELDTPPPIPPSQQPETPTQTHEYPTPHHPPAILPTDYRRLKIKLSKIYKRYTHQRHLTIILPKIQTVADIKHILCQMDFILPGFELEKQYHRLNNYTKVETLDDDDLLYQKYPQEDTQMKDQTNQHQIKDIETISTITTPHRHRKRHRPNPHFTTTAEIPVQEQLQKTRQTLHLQSCQIQHLYQQQAQQSQYQHQLYMQQQHLYQQQQNQIDYQHKHTPNPYIRRHLTYYPEGS